MRYIYYHKIYFIATFNVQCELCGNSFTFEKEFYFSADGYSPEYAKNKAIARKDALVETLKMLVIQEANINVPIIQKVGTKDTKFAIVGLVKPYKCPKCGYLQSWMLMDARRRHFLPRSLLYGFMFTIVIVTSLVSFNHMIEEKSLPPIYELLLTSLLVIMAVMGVAGAVVIRRNWLKYNPNAEVLQGRPTPTETHLTQVSFRPGRLTGPL
jgi:hypothetical protein